MSELNDAIQRLPLESWIPILVLTVLGLGLWLAGGRLLRTAFGIMGFIVGSGLGWLIGHTVDFGVAVWVVALVGGLLLACLATLAYRVAVAGGLALVVAVAAPLAVWSAAGGAGGLEGGGDRSPAVEPGPQPAEAEEEPGPGAEVERQLQDFVDQARERLRGDRDREADSTREPPAETARIDEPDDAQTREAGEPFELREEFEEQLESARAFAEELAAHGRRLWDSTPPDLRDRLVGAAIVGGLIGFLFGTLASTASAWIVTAFAGALMSMVGAWSAATKLQVLESDWLPLTPSGWLSAWVIISVIGLIIQWMTRSKRADKAA